MNLCVHKIFSFLFVILMTSYTFAQDTLRINEAVIKSKKLQLKKKGLYDGDFIEDYNIRGFTQDILFEHELLDFWSTEDLKCIEAKTLDYSEENVLNIKWNKDQDGCDWVGFGIGWDGWKSKDFAYVIDTLALELVVRSTGDSFTNIPWAFCFEDYKGSQAWLGYNSSFLKGDAILKEWTKVVLPLSLFPFDEFDTDAANIKQLLVQLFSEGEIEINSIKLVPFSGKLKNDFLAQKQSIHIDGDFSDWDGRFELFSGQQFSVSYSDEYLNLAFIVIDSTPMQNSKIEGDLWNGDAVEFAFSTNPNANDKRNFLLLSDQHIGINCGDSPYVWDFKRSQLIPNSKLKIIEVNTGYIVESSIPLEYFKNLEFKSGIDLDMEVAIDLGNNENRQTQIRWNSNNKDGFHQNPSMWGNLLIQ
ncbi:MAG: hypothetical protein CL823_01965 [Crocinitomicaceae bacterium]|nr:hypothetical protein [Crocinitomicaceae bacterium]